MESMESKKKIVLIDDDIVSLLVGKNALLDAYDLHTVPSGKALFELLAHIVPDLLLLDIEMPGMDGYEVLNTLRSDPRTVHIPVIFMTGKDKADDELAGLELGAVDYITKPIAPALLRKRIAMYLLMADQQRQLERYNAGLQQMVAQKTHTILALQNAVVELLSVVVEYRDDQTGGHIHRTRRYLAIIMEEMLRSGVYAEEVASWDRQLMVLASALHDVGKLAIPDSILLKPDPLNAEELAIIKKHPEYGGDIIERVEYDALDRSFIEHARIMATTHHEKWDGTGYPLGLAGTEIPLQGRLMALADVYDALLFRRPYKPAMSHEEALEVIRRGSGAAFDPALVTVVLKAADRLEEASLSALE
ncbi:MAG: response regulator [Deltaproteobacteria bacterium]|nr:response regulator [Deltaproteobacteria bacterium]